MADLPTESQQLAIRAAQECKALRTLINGNAVDLSSLATTDKTSLVAAINEIFNSGGGGGETTLTNYSQISALTGYPASFPPTIGTTSTTALAGNTALLQIGITGTTAMAGNKTASDIGGLAATGGTMTNGTISGTLTINSTTITFGPGAAAAMRTAMGSGTTGVAVFIAATQAAAKTAIGITRCGFAAQNSSTTINAATLTVVAFATELEDTNSAWDGSAFTVPAGKGGLWEIRGGYVFTSVTAASFYVVTVSVNSTTAGMYMIGRGIAGGTGLCGAGGSVAVPLAAGDVIRMMVFCTNATTGYNGAVGYCTFSAHLLT
jgi:hypothetical protein